MGPRIWHFPRDIWFPLPRLFNVSPFNFFDCASRAIFCSTEVMDQPFLEQFFGITVCSPEKRALRRRSTPTSLSRSTSIWLRSISPTYAFRRPSVLETVYCSRVDRLEGQGRRRDHRQVHRPGEGVHPLHLERQYAGLGRPSGWRGFTASIAMRLRDSPGQRRFDRFPS